jgi:hypothetical protein
MMPIHTKKKLGVASKQRVVGGLASLPITVSDERAHCPLVGRHPTQNNEEPEK